MNLDLNIGDILLGGRFKNKRIVVKSIGEDELGQPIVNGGRKLLSVRIEKKLPEGMWSTKTLAEKYKGKEMNKQAYLQEVYDLAHQDELEKLAGLKGISKAILGKKITRKLFKIPIVDIPMRPAKKNPFVLSPKGNANRRSNIEKYKKALKKQERIDKKHGL